MPFWLVSIQLAQRQIEKFWRPLGGATAIDEVDVSAPGTCFLTSRAGATELE